MFHEFFIAYSIGRASVSITASIQVELEVAPPFGGIQPILGVLYAVGRASPSHGRQATKLLHPDLSGMTDPRADLAYFQRLYEQGWAVTDSRFKAHHARKLSAPPPTAKSPEPVG